jgi:transposase
MRKGLDGLATLIQEHLKKDPFSGHLFVFRGKNASLLKILFWDGTGDAGLGAGAASYRAHRSSQVRACRACNRVVQAAAPERLIAGGLATPALLAQVLVSKYCDHTPLYRQSQIFARHGVDLCRSTLAGWVGGACWWLEDLHERLCKNVFASDHLFADDTPIPVLDPGRGRTKTGRLWVYAREQRPWGGPSSPMAPPAAMRFQRPARSALSPLVTALDAAQRAVLAPWLTGPPLSTIRFPARS